MRRLFLLATNLQDRSLFRNLSLLMYSRNMSQIIHAPSEEPSRWVKSVFLAGATSKVDTSDWGQVLSSALSKLLITIYTPFHPDWDSSWYEDIECRSFREQTLWELEKQAKGDFVVVYFQPATQAPVSLLEFGFSAQCHVKVIAVCPNFAENVVLVLKKLHFETNLERSVPILADIPIAREATKTLILTRPPSRVIFLRVDKLIQVHVHVC